MPAPGAVCGILGGVAARVIERRAVDVSRIDRIIASA